MAVQGRDRAPAAGGAGAAGRVPAARASRRADAGAVRLSQRDIEGLLLAGEHYGVPFDLLAAALQVRQDRLPPIVARWRRIGYADTGRLGPGPAWCWLTRDGMAATGLGFPAGRPALARLAHIRAVLAVRLWLQVSPGWRDGQGWWHSERRLRAAHRPLGGGQVSLGSGQVSLGGGQVSWGGGHVADAEIHWPSIEGGHYAGQVWAVEVELTPKPVARTAGIMIELLRPMRYARVIYLTAPAAHRVVTRAVAGLPPGEQVRMVVRELPASAFSPEPPGRGSGGSARPGG